MYTANYTFKLLYLIVLHLSNTRRRQCFVIVSRLHIHSSSVIKGAVLTPSLSSIVIYSYNRNRK